MPDMLQTAIIVLVVGTALSFLAKRSLTSRPITDYEGNVVLKYPVALRYFGSIGCLFLTALALAAPIMARNETQHIFSLVIVTCVTIGLALLCLYGVFEFPFVRITIAPDGLHGRTPLKGQQYISWNDISSIEYSSGPQWFLIKDTNDRSIRAHLYLSGIKQLYLELKRRVPEDRWKNTYEAFESL